MPRRRALTEAQLETLLALPGDEMRLLRHWILDGADRAAAERRRGSHNQLGFALQLCAFRYPGRLLRPGEVIPDAALRFVADQLHVDPATLAAYAARPQTRREQLDALREEFGFRMFGPGHGRDLLAWLLPVALATTNASAIATALMDELRRRRIIAPGLSVLERLIAAVLVVAERHVAGQLTKDLSTAQVDALDALLGPKEGTATSVLAWARQPPGAPGHRALARIVEQLTCLRAVGLKSAIAEGVHPERLRKLAREGARFTSQHLRSLSPLRRRATLVATALDTATRLTDDGVALFDRAVGRMFRRAEAREEEAVLRDARAVNDKVRLLAKLGAALIAAKADGADLDGAVEDAVGWDRLAASIAEANKLARPDKADLPALATRAWPVLHRLGPLFLATFQLRAAPAAASTLRAVELLQIAYGSGGRRWPGSLPVSFLQPAWRDAVLGTTHAGGSERRTWEAATLLALRGRLRSGDIWVEGSRQWRAVEDQLIAPALFQAMRDAGPLPVAMPATAAEYLEGRRALLDRRLAEVAAKATADKLEDVRIKAGELKVTPLKAVTPEAAEAAADRLYGMVPGVRVTGMLAEVDRWTGFSRAFTHLHTGLPASDPRLVLTAVLADATNLGLTRMADACDIASYRQLAWNAGWHLREDTYRPALGMLASAQHNHPLAALFGAADVSSSDGQHFPTAGRGEAVGAFNAHTAARRRRCSTRTYPTATRRSTPRRSPAPARRRTSSTACSTMRQTSASPPITPMAVASATTCLRWRMSWASASPRASPTWPNGDCMPLALPAPGRRSRRSSQASPTRGQSPPIGTTCCALRPRSAPEWSARRCCSSASAATRGRTAWPWRCARSAASSAPSTPWTGWSSPPCGGRPPWH
jgi:hypothetical protein